MYKFASQINRTMANNSLRNLREDVTVVMVAKESKKEENPSCYAIK